MSIIACQERCEFQKYVLQDTGQDEDELHLKDCLIYRASIPENGKQTSQVAE